MSSHLTNNQTDADAPDTYTIININSKHHLHQPTTTATATPLKDVQTLSYIN